MLRSCPVRKMFLQIYILLCHPAEMRDGFLRLRRLFHRSGVKTVQVEFKNIDGSRRLCEIEGSEKELPCDLILIAAGFLGCEDYTAKAFNVKLSQRNTVESFGEETPEKASPNGYKTPEEKIFTAGDMHRGQSLVVWAIAEGRECAKEIDEYLMGYSNM